MRYKQWSHIWLIIATMCALMYFIIGDEFYAMPTLASLIMAKLELMHCDIKGG